MEKSQARQLVREAIRRMTPIERARASTEIARRVLELPECGAAAVVMGFLPLPDELDTLPLLTQLIRMGKTVCVPRTNVKERSMLPVRLRSVSDLRTGEYGIPEPAAPELCDPSSIDLLLLPGRAFDRAGNRLGRGGGFYDRFVAQNAPRAVRCGIAFSCQLLDSVPHTNTDVPAEIIVTETGTIRTRAR